MAASGHFRTIRPPAQNVRFRVESRHLMSAFRGLFCRLLSCPDDAVHARPADPQASGYLCSSNALVFKSYDLFPVGTLEAKRALLKQIVEESWLVLLYHDRRTPLGRVVTENDRHVLREVRA